MGQNTINPAQKKMPVARVNGVVISEYQVASALQILLEPYKDTKGKVRLPQQEMYAARKHAIDNLVMRELLYQEGCRTGIVADVLAQRPVRLKAADAAAQRAVLGQRHETCVRRLEP